MKSTTFLQMYLLGNLVWTIIQTNYSLPLTFMSSSKWWIHYNGVKTGRQSICVPIRGLIANIKHHQIDRQIQFGAFNISLTSYQCFGIDVNSNTEPIQRQLSKLNTFFLMFVFTRCSYKELLGGRGLRYMEYTRPCST